MTNHPSQLPAATASRALKVCIVSTIKAPLKETLMFVNYHLNVGVDHIFLFFDDPEDEAISELENYRSVTRTRCDATYWQKNAGERPSAIESRQRTNNNRGLAQAISAGFHWSIFIDHDELLHTRVGIKDTLAKATTDVVRFTLYEAVSERMHYDSLYATSLFKTSGRSVQVWLAGTLGCQKAFFEGKYFRGHLDSKVAISLDSGINKVGIHGPEDHSHRCSERTTKDIVLLHFDCVGFDAWKAKGLNRIRPNSASGLRGNRLRQQQLFADALRQDDAKLEAVYRDIFLIPKREQRILRLLRMLTTITIDPALFMPPIQIAHRREF